MNIAILAANGQIAQLVTTGVLTQPQFASSNITLMLRHKERLAKLTAVSRVTVVEGDLNQPNDVINATKGADLVFVAVVDHDDAGGNRPTKNLLKAASINGFNRVITTSLLGIYDEVPGSFGQWNKDTCFGGDPRGSAPTTAAELLESSDLNYTILRLPWLNNRAASDVIITHRNETYIGTSASRQTVANLVLQIVAEPQLYQRDSIGMTDPATQNAQRPVY